MNAVGNYKSSASSKAILTLPVSTRQSSGWKLDLCSFRCSNAVGKSFKKSYFVFF